MKFSVSQFLAHNPSVLARRLAAAALASALTLALGACAIGAGSQSNLPSDTAAIPAAKGVVIVGVAGNASAMFRPGTLFDNGSFEHARSSSEQFSSELGQPYIVQALAPTSAAKRYAIFRASLGGKIYDFDCGQVLPVLTVRSGEAQYYGDFEVRVEGGKLKVVQSFNIDKAQQYIDRYYPNSGWEIKPGELARARSTQCLQVPPAAIVG